MDLQRLNRVFDEVHLYENKIESFLRVLGWVASWAGGILSIVINSKTLFSSAYFIFSISLLMEFAPRIDKIKYKLGRIIYTLFCFSIAIIWIISVISLLTGIDDNYVLNIIMFIISICVLVYMIIDCAILWLFGFEKKTDVPSKNSNSNISEKAEVCFNKNLSSGQLGSIGEK